MESKVFISYNHKDVLAADMLCNALENRKIKVWYAPRDIKGGSYPQAICEAISNVDIFVVIISKNSINSYAVLNELELAAQEISRGRELLIMPIKLDTEELSSDMRYYLSRQHWSDASVPTLEDRIYEFSGKICLVSKSKVNEAATEKTIDSFVNFDGINSIDECIKIANKYVNDQKLDIALQAYDKAVSLLDGGIDNVNEIAISMHLFRGRARILIELGKYDNALSDLGRALDYTPSRLDTYIYNDIGDVYMRQGLFEKAIENYTQSTVMNRVEYGVWPQYILIKRGKAYTEIGDYFNASKDFYLARYGDVSVNDAVEIIKKHFSE